MAKQQRDPAKEAYWREALARHTDSGLSVREFCQRERLAEPSFYAWRRTIAERDAGESQPSFVPAVVTNNMSVESSIALELPGGCVLKFAGPMATDRLADLIVALQARSLR